MSGTDGVFLALLASLAWSLGCGFNGSADSKKLDSWLLKTNSSVSA